MPLRFKPGPRLLPATLDADSPVLSALLELAGQNLATLLRIDDVRYLLTQHRLRRFRHLGGEIAVAESQDMIGSAVRHNLEAIEKPNAIGRSMQLLGPLLGISQVIARKPSLKVLILGPRTESEILLFAAYGFTLANLRGLDLISYSPWVDVGDMHDMPYRKGQFDVVFASCVLAYSSNRTRAAAEIRRVLRPGGLICIAEGYEPLSPEAVGDLTERAWGYRLEGTSAKSAAEVIELFGTDPADVVFRTEPLGEERNAASRIAVILRNGSPAVASSVPGTV